MKRTIKIAEMLVIFTVMGLYSLAQVPTYSCMATADTLLTSQIYQFDIYMYRTGTTDLYLNNYQLSFKINNSAGILNGGTITGAYVAGTSQLPSSFLPGGVSIFDIGGTVCIRVNGTQSSSNGVLVPPGGIKIGSFQFTNTSAFGPINPNTIWWDYNPATTYVYAIVPPAPTGTVMEISNNTSHTSSFTDPVFNLPVASFNVTGTGVYCSGTSGLVVGLDGSEAGVMYYMLKNGIQAGPAITGTGSPLSFGLQTSGVYTINAYRKATYLSSLMNGSAIITLSTVNPTLSGNTVACQGSAGNIYTTEAGMTNYIWSVSGGGSISSGGTPTSNSVTITWNTSGSQNLSVNYTNVYGCAASLSTVYNVNVNPLPVPSITGPTANVCQGSAFNTYSTQTGMNNYTWTVSPGGNITSGQGTSQVQVTWNTSGPQWVAANYSNTAGCSAASPAQLALTVTPTPGTAGAITGTSTLCAGTTGIPYSVAPISNTTYYVWILPPGASIASGIGTNNVTIDFAANAASGDITVYGNNICGNGGSSPAFPVTVNLMPLAAGTVTGSSNVCQGSQGIVYSVTPIANATSYSWTVPQGVTIVSGLNTHEITVNFSMTATPGNISVFGSNSCGNGTVSPPFAVAITPKPPKPTVTASGYLLTSSAPDGNQWYWNGIAVAGATNQTLVVPPANSGYYWSIVTLNTCPSDSSNHVYIAGVGIPDNESLSFNVYPVPNDGLFTATVSSRIEETYHIAIYNTLGVMVFKSNEFKVSGKHDEIVDIRKLPAGIYSVVFSNENRKVVREIFINK